MEGVAFMIWGEVIAIVLEDTRKEAQAVRVVTEAGVCADPSWGEDCGLY